MKIEVKNKKEFSVDLTAEGNIEQISCGKNCWNGYPGSLTIIDELRGKIFGSANAKASLIENCKSKLVFEKHWDDCEFILREIWTAFADCISWRTEVVLKTGCQERSVQIKQLFPYPYPAYKLQVWSANESFPCPLEQLGGLRLYYGDACYGTVIPAVSIYDENKDVGFTLSKPFSLKSARLAFNFKDYHSDGLEIENSCLYLGQNNTAVTELLIHAQEGCWRPGLGWLYSKYPEYFDSPNSRVHELEGGFMITNPYTEDDYLETVPKYKVKWAEVHNHFPMYGNYAPEGKEWDSVISHDYTDLPVPSEKLSVDKINRHINGLHNSNIKALLYFQCAGDAFVPYAEEFFPDSIVRDPHGKTVTTWKECCFLNASQGTSFGMHLEKQIDKFLADYPEIDGVFLDQMCYQTLDCNHYDGITAYDNKPASMFGYSYRHNLNKLADIIHSQGKFIWGNGPFDIEVQKKIDGIMSEGSSSICNTYKYLCISKPLLVHTYPDSALNVEKMFKYCILCGASYSIGGSSKLPVPEPVSREIQELFEKCIPLVEKTLHTEWLLEPAPLKLPDGYDGNIFVNKTDNSLIVSIVSRYGSLLNSTGKEHIKLEIKSRLLKEESEIKVYSTTSPDTLKVNSSFKDNRLKLNMEDHAVMSVIVIK